MATGMTADALFRLKASNETGPTFLTAGKNLQRLNEQAAKADRAFGSMKGYENFTRMVGGAIGGGAMLGFAKSVISAGDEIGDMADMTGFGVESIQSLMIVAKDAGIRLDRLRGTIGDLRGKMDEARVEGGEKLAAAFAKLGVSADMLASGDVEAVFERIAGALQAGAGNASVTAAAHDVLGSSVEKLAPIFRAAADGMAKLNAEMKAGGEIMSEQDVKRLADADRKLQQIGNSARVMAARGASAIEAWILNAKAAGAGVSNVAGDLASGRLPWSAGDKEMSESFDAGAGYVFATKAEEKAALRPRAFKEPKGPSNFVEMPSDTATESLANQGLMLTVLDKIAGHMERIERNQGRGLGPVGR